MKVSLVSTTVAQIDGQDMTAEQLVVYIARVSNPNNQSNIATADRLIAYLIEHKHWSPFEMVDMCVRIETSRAIAAQILRHRSFSFQEFSQRYAEATELEPIEFRMQAATNRQSSTDLANNEALESEANELLNKSKDLYKRMIEQGIAKESARFILPLNTQTRIYMKGSVRSWIHYLQIRCDGHTQKEHRQIAEGIKTIFATVFPNISKNVFNDTTAPL